MVFIKPNAGSLAELTQARFHPAEDTSQASWNRTIRAKERLVPGHHPDLNAVFANRIIIERDSRIAGGVYVGGSGREAIVVDWKQPELNKLYNNLTRAIRSSEHKDQNTALAGVFFFVRDAFPNLSESKTDKLIKGLNLRPDKKVHIDYFIANGTGVCRHVAACCAVLIERLIDEGYLKGKVSIDRNTIAQKGAHAWCRFTDSKGEVIILDVMHDYAGRLSKTAAKANWDYFRPEDQKPSKIRVALQKVWYSLFNK